MAGVPSVSGAADATRARGNEETQRWRAADLAALNAILGRKWTAAIFVALSDGPVRHGALCRRLRGISRKVLHESLAGLIRDGVVEKIIGADDVGGASVAYGLTPLGASLRPVFDAMQKWCAAHLDDIARARSDGGSCPRVAGGPSPAVTSR